MAKAATPGRATETADVDGSSLPFQDPHAVRVAKVNNLEISIGLEVRTLRM